MSSTGGGRFGEIFAQTRGPSLIDIMQAAGWTKAQRDQRDMQREQQQAAFEQQTYERDAATRDRMAADRRQAQADALALKKQQADAAAQLDKDTANAAQAYSQLPPDRQQAAAAYMDNLAKKGKIRTDWNAGAAVPVQSAVQGIKPPPEQQIPIDAVAQRVVRGWNIPLNDPKFPAAYEQARKEMAQEAINARKAGAVNISLGEKPLPTEAAGGLGEAEAAKKALDQLLADYEKGIASDSVFDQVVNRVTAKLPNTDASVYENQAASGAQIYGRYMEGGKLAKDDRETYSPQVPHVGDSLKTARQKVEQAKRLIDIRDAELRRSYHGSGYRVPDKAQAGQTPTPDEIDAEIRAINGGQ